MIATTLTPQQTDLLRRTHRDLGTLLAQLGLLDDPRPAVADPQWIKDVARQWSLLDDLAANHGGGVGADEWSRLGRRHGYDPRGLGGFFVGAKPLMERQGARRVLTDHGRRFIERWRADVERAPEDSNL